MPKSQTIRIIDSKRGGGGTGNIGAIESHTHDSRYYTETETAARDDAINARVTSINRIVTATDDYTITADDRTVVADKATAITITLPPLLNVVGLLTEIGYKFNIVAAGIGVVTVAADGAETIIGQSSIVLEQYDSVALQPTIAGWWIL